VGLGWYMYNWENADPALDNQICQYCKHPFALHNQYNCTYAFEKHDECMCGANRQLLEARYWARFYYSAYSRLKCLLDRPDIQYYIAWWNANRND
jgi:hypothetical protein